MPDAIGIESVIEAVVARLSGQLVLPPPKLCVRSDTAEKMLDLPAGTLANDRRDAKRGGPLKFPFVKFGARVLYRVEDLIASVDRLSHQKESCSGTEG